MKYFYFLTKFSYWILFLLSGTLQPRGRRPLARAGVAFSQERADGRARAHQAGPEAQVGHPARIAAQLVHPAVAVTGQTSKGKAPHQTPKVLNSSSTKSALPLIVNSTRDFFWVLYVSWKEVKIVFCSRAAYVKIYT